MSYSFSVRAATKAEASLKVAAELATVVASQPVHAADQAAAQMTADSFILVVREDETQDIGVSVNGSLWGTDGGINQASVSISVSLVAKQPG
jgi:hypothetical protein